MSLASTVRRRLEGRAAWSAVAEIDRWMQRCGVEAAVEPEQLDHLFVEDGPMRWHVTTMGRGPVALLLHGTGASSHSFLGLMALLAEHFTVVAPDLPGHALTRVPPSFVPSLPNMAAALGRLVARLDQRPRVVVGHSAGAALAARMTIDRAVEPTLVVGLAAALVPFPRLARAVLSPAAELLSRSVVPVLIASGFARTRRVDRIVRSTGSALGPYGIERYRRLVERPEHVEGALSMMAQWDLAPLYDALPRLDVPFLLLSGGRDRAVSVAQTRAASARLPRATMVVLEQAGHLLHEEQPQRVSRLILEHEARSRRRPEDS